MTQRGPYPAIRGSAPASVVALSHGDVRARLSDYLDGGLAEGEAQDIREHLDRCHDCRAFLATLGRTIELLRTMPAPTVLPAAKERAREGAARPCMLD
ncbi:MAG: zf-HC2 domain-containing protein [Chloroflexi bacterium]|nr:zf-HC2 domain-containing protein [Chloroflexota bacterium]